MFEGNLYSLFFEFIKDFVQNYGFLGIFSLSFLETLFAPLPSEIVLPFAGYIAWKQDNFIFAIIAIFIGALGNTLGSLPIYYLGYLGKEYVKKFGKYFFVKEKNLKKVEKWFVKNAFFTIFLTRFVPGIRSLASIPAGIFKIELKIYFILTFFGFLIWNLFLVLLGYYLGNYWELSLQYASQIEFFSLIVFIAIIVYLILKYLI